MPTPNETIKMQLRSLPDRPGIYLYYDIKKQLIYVGKATSLKSRVRSYFSGKKTPRPIEEMLHEVVSIEWIETESVLEAVILEANYIKKYQPKYNVLGKDDKSWNYIAITKDEYPAITLLREHNKKQLSVEEQKKTYQYIFGPYPGLNGQAALKLLRRLFMISTCKPHQGRPCLYYQMHQCLGVCTGEISPKIYREKVIRPLVSLLKGEKKRLLTNLKKQMAQASKEEAFEEAARLRNQIDALEKIYDVTLINKSFFEMLSENNVGDFKPFRIEGYDISNLGDTGKVGSMVVFEQDHPALNQYRKFKIKYVPGQSDVACLEEVLVRRCRRILTRDKRFASHDPDLFLIDGGLPQVNRAKRVVAAFRLNIPIVGIAKGPDRKKNEFIFGTPSKRLKSFVYAHEDVLIRVRDEAHRFAITYQRSLRKIKKNKSTKK